MTEQQTEQQEEERTRTAAKFHDMINGVIYISYLAEQMGYSYSYFHHTLTGRNPVNERFIKLALQNPLVRALGVTEETFYKDGA